MSPSWDDLHFDMIGRAAWWGVLISLLAASTVTYAEPAAGTAPVEVPMHVQSGHIYVDVQINGQGPFHFVFDTGALNVLTPAAAARLGLATRGNVKASGTGGSQNVSSTKVGSVQLGNLTLADQTFYVAELPSTASEETQIDGLIGFEWLERFPMRLDYAASRLTFYPDKSANYAGSALPIPIHFRGRIAEVDGAVDGIAGRFSIDTGSSGSLTLSVPFVAQHDLAARYGAKTKVMSAIGVGGPVYALLARANVLDLGGAKVERPVTFLSQQTAGTSMRKDLAGNVGFGVLHQFNIFFDYPHTKIYFEPNAYWGEPDLADRSGLRIERADGAFNVLFVAENSPAMAAGIKAGDRLVAVDGISSENLTLSDLRAKFKGQIGNRISIKRDVSEAIVVIELKDM